MNLKRLRPYLEYLEQAGLEVVDASVSGSQHYKITVTAAGKQRFFIAAYSASDRRSFQNWKSDVRRWKKEVDNEVRA